MPAADCIPALGNGSVPTSCQLVTIDDGVLKSVVNEFVRWKSCSSLVAVPVGPAPPAITIWRSSIVHGRVKPFKKQVPPPNCARAPAAAPDLALGRGPGGAALNVHPELPGAKPKKLYCQKVP